VAALVTGLTPVFAFVAAMMAGMVLYALLFERPDRSNVWAEPAKPGRPLTPQRSQLRRATRESGPWVMMQPGAILTPEQYER
jgi:hypothetical protein